MTEYTVTKNKIIEVSTRVPAEIRLFKNLETGKIIGELIIDQAFFGDFNLEDSDIACLPNDATWKPFFEKQFDKFDTSNLVREE